MEVGGSVDHRALNKISDEAERMSGLHEPLAMKVVRQDGEKCM